MEKLPPSPKPSFFSMHSPLRSNLRSSTAKSRSLCWQKSVKEDNVNWKTVDRPDPTTASAEELRRTRMAKRRCSAPTHMPLAMEMQARKPSLKSIQMMKNGSCEVPSVGIFYSRIHKYLCIHILNVNILRTYQTITVLLYFVSGALQCVLVISLHVLFTKYAHHQHRRYTTLFENSTAIFKCW